MYRPCLKITNQSVVAYYLCPYQIGNRMFHFLNSFVAAFIMNRSLTYNYCADASVCPLAGSQARCDQYIKPNTWLHKSKHAIPSLNINGDFSKAIVNMIYNRQQNLDIGILEGPKPWNDAKFIQCSRMATSIFSSLCLRLFRSVWNAL